MRLFNRVSIENVLVFILFLSISACKKTSEPISLEEGTSAPASNSGLPDSDTSIMRILSFSKDPVVIKHFGTDGAAEYDELLKSVVESSAKGSIKKSSDKLMALSTAENSSPANGRMCKGIKDDKEYGYGDPEVGIQKLGNGVGFIEYEIIQKIDCEDKCYIFSYKDSLKRKYFGPTKKPITFMDHYEENVDMKTCLDCSKVYDKPTILVDGKVMENISQQFEYEYCEVERSLLEEPKVVRFFSKGKTTLYNPSTTGHPRGCLSTPQFSTDVSIQYLPPKPSTESLSQYEDRVFDLYEAEYERLGCTDQLTSPEYPKRRKGIPEPWRNRSGE